MATGGRYSRSAEKGSEPFYDFFCGPCAKEGNNVEAVKGCVDCRENFCVKCLKDHNKFEGMKGHQILNKAGMMASGLQASVFIPKEKCTTHPGKGMEMFCGAHDLVCCAVCIAMDHRLCTCVDYIPNVAKGIKHSTEVRDVGTTMKQMQLDLKKIKKVRQEDIKRTGQEKTRITTDIDAFRDRIVKHLDKLVKEAKDEVQKKQTKLENEANADIQNLQDMISKLDANIENLETSNLDNEAQLFLIVKQGKQQKSHGSQLLQALDTTRSGEIMKFTINTSIMDYFMNLKSIGHIHNNQSNPLSPASTQDQPTNKVSESKMISSAPNQGQPQIKVTKCKPISSALLQGKYTFSGDKQTMILGSCLLEDGSLLLADNTVTNNKLLRLDRKYNIIDQCALRYPSSLCKTGSKEVAVALNDKTIQFVSTTGKLKLTRSFKTDKDCTYAAFSDGELFVSEYGGFDDYSGVSVYSLAGEKLRTFQNVNSAKEMIFCLPRQIDISSNGTNVYVSDGANGVHIFNRQGSLQSTLTSPDLKYAWGVCKMEDGNLLVSCCKNKSILQMDSLTRKSHVLLSRADVTDEPRALCYDKDTDRLIVTFDRADHIKVFTLIRE